MILCGIIDRLCDTISVTEVDEDESSMVTTIGNPACESDSVSDVR